MNRVRLHLALVLVLISAAAFGHGSHGGASWPPLAGLHAAAQDASACAAAGELDTLRAIAPNLAALSREALKARMPRKVRKPLEVRLGLEDIAALGATLEKQASTGDAGLAGTATALAAALEDLMRLGGVAAQEKVGKSDGVLAALYGTDGARVGTAELKLHDDKGDLELWLFDSAGKRAMGLPPETLVTVKLYVDPARTVELRVRNTTKNEDEDGRSTMRGGMTHYFIFPGNTGTDASWLQGEFSAAAIIQLSIDGEAVASRPFMLAPHSHDHHGPHHH